MKFFKMAAVSFLLLSASIISAARADECPANQECHYQKSCIYTAVGIGAVTLYYAPTIIGWGLGAMGFGPLGPMLGTAAAAWQSKIGLVASGSLFAALQSAGMAGVSKTIILGAGTAVSSAIFATCPCTCSSSATTPTTVTQINSTSVEV